MRLVFVSLVLASALTPIPAQQVEAGPANEKARRAYQEALQYLREGKKLAALDGFKRADRLAGGQCLACEKKMITYGCESGDWKAAELGAQEIVAAATLEADIAVAHYQFGYVLLVEGTERHKDEFFSRAHDELSRALAARADFPEALFLDGRVLANLRQDEEAKARFAEYAKMKPGDGPEQRRALRYVDRPELARARMAPPFAISTAGGQRISMDDLQGKVVLIDFWATWCGPCRQALPHIREVARKFQGQPLVILSVSLDSDERTWKEFVAKNQMTWPQCRDGGFGGSLAKLFGVNAIPHTFTIDADGVLQDEHVGDAAFEGKLKKLLARARQ